MSAETVAISSEFDIFARKPVQTAVLDTIEAVYTPIAPVDQSGVEFLIPFDNDTYIDPDIKLYIRGKLISGDRKDLDATDFTAVTNNFLRSLFSECYIAFNGTAITQSGEFYHYRFYLETLLTYGSDEAASHLTNTFWYLDNGDMLPCDPTAIHTETTNREFITR